MRSGFMNSLQTNTSIFQHVQNRVVNNYNGEKQKRVYFNFPTIISSLAKVEELEGHDGCVNTVSFSECGDFLLSGSDDLHLNIYDFHHDFKLKKRIRTGHNHNIFKAKYFYGCNSSKIISSSCDHSLFFTDINYIEESQKNKFNCHNSIPFEIIVLESEPYIFLVCSTEGSVRQYDLREKISCKCHGCTRDVVIHLPCQINSMDICPTRTYECAIAFNNGQIHFFDRRKLYTSARDSDSGKNASMFSLGTYARHPTLTNQGFTSLKYSKDGSNIVCNVVGEKVIVVSCDFDKSMKPNGILTPHPECYTRSSYFDANSTNVRKYPHSDTDISQPDLDRDPGAIAHSISQDDIIARTRERSIYWFTIEAISNIKPPLYTPLKSREYTGHSNVKTMLKEAIFWGNRFVMAGSDCGRLFIWDRNTEKICKLLTGDRHIVNSLAHHPYYPVLVCSGIDNTIKVFKPTIYSKVTNLEIENAISFNRNLLENYRDFDELSSYDEIISQTDESNT